MGRASRPQGIYLNAEEQMPGDELRLQLRESEDRFRRMADAIPEVIWITELHPERVLYASPSFERIWDLPVDGLLRKPRLWTEPIHPEDRDRVTDAFTRWIAGEGVSYTDIEFRIVRPDGTIRWIHQRGVLSLDAQGRPFRASGLSTDITARKRAEAELRLREAYLMEAERVSKTGSFALNMDTGTFVMSPETYRICGSDPGRTLSLRDVVEIVHPEDRTRSLEKLYRAARHREGFDMEHRLVMADGSIKHTHAVGNPHVREDGALEFIGAIIDVTETTRAQRALEEALAENQVLRERLQRENLALREEVDAASMFEEIVGESPALQTVLSRVSKVAPTDSTVLITGETGTGKELVARAIHKRSARASRAFVSVNCAAIPSSLIASELFGHEKGAFTGALQARLGRFELADGGTIFLDEVGELPATTQVALLRVLQEREFERVGGTRVIKADVRVIAATNRDLHAAVAVGAFRNDLFYRLHVFPIEIPPLRDRRADIPMLVEYFIDRFSRKAGKPIRRIDATTMARLQDYHWPGNIRELQNVIERSLILGESDTFTVDASWLAGAAVGRRASGDRLLEQLAAQERDLVEAALAASRGKVYGPSGAAVKLGIPPSTLDSKIKALNIDKHRYKSR